MRLQDGREAAALLCITYFPDEEGDGAHIGVQFQIDPDGSGELVSIMPHWGEGWTKEVLTEVFNIDPDSPIRDVEKAGSK